MEQRRSQSGICKKAKREQKEEKYCINQKISVILQKET
jgi:hypothetical protein